MDKRCHASCGFLKVVSACRRRIAEGGIHIYVSITTEHRYCIVTTIHSVNPCRFIEATEAMQKENLAHAPQKSKGRPRAFDRDEALVRALDVFWRRGYEPASVAELCTAMGINPPSLYAAFGNKAKLFLEAVNHYERVYWDETWARMGQEADLHRAIEDFFRESAHILTSPKAPCGCLVVLAAINAAPESHDVIEALKVLRQEGREHFLKRLKRGIKDGHLPPKADVKSLASALNTLLEGMSIQARDGLSRAEMEDIGRAAGAMLPVRPADKGQPG